MQLGPVIKNPTRPWFLQQRNILSQLACIRTRRRELPRPLTQHFPLNSTYTIRTLLLAHNRTTK
jgi:hypothetical protein